jgi:hypothetical protein
MTIALSSTRIIWNADSIRIADPTWNAMGQKDLPSAKPTLEINPDHEIVKKLLARSDGPIIEDAAWLLLDQALLMEGVPLAGSSGVCEAAEPRAESFDLGLGFGVGLGGNAQDDWIVRGDGLLKMTGCSRGGIIIAARAAGPAGRW